MNHYFLCSKIKFRVVNKISVVYTRLYCNSRITFLCYIFNILEKNNIVYKSLIIRHLVVSFLFEWSLRSFEEENAIIMSLVLNYRYFRKNVFFSHLMLRFTSIDLDYLSFFFFYFFYCLLKSSCRSHYLFWFSRCSHYLSRILSFSHYLLRISLYYFYIIVLVSLYSR